MQLNKFNRQQKQAICELNSPLLVIAAAGSGKTGVITAKIAYLINDKNIAPERICALTFTNKAAQEMQERLTNYIDKKCASKIKLGTFHSLGLEFLKKEAKKLGYRNGISILDPQDVLAFLKDFLNDDVQLAKEAAKFINECKNNLLAPEDAQNIASGEQEIFIQSYHKYKKQLKACNSVDLDDLIYQPVKALSSDAEILHRWQHKFDYILVDEYQDTNLAQYKLIKLLTGSSHAFTVVGDDYQSIYAFRGARPKNLQELTQDFKDLKIIKLEQNYRSTNTILQAANALIAKNNNMFEKKLWSEKGKGDAIKIIRAKTEDAEAERVINDIYIKKLNNNSKWQDFAILYRSNHQSKLLEIKLQEMNIPYKISGGTSFFDRTEIKDIVAYLRILINSDDNVAFFRIVNTPRRNIGASTLEKLSEYSQKREVSLYQASQEFGLAEEITQNAHRNLTTFCNYMDKLREKLYTSNEPFEILHEMLEDINYMAWLEKNSASLTIAEKRFANIKFFLKSLEKVYLRLEEEQSDRDNIALAINKLVLRAWLEKREEDEEENAVFLSTLHAAKGLEFPHVYIVGFEEGILPHKNSITSDDIEEERRLAYVGITRSQETLTLSLAQKRRSFDGVNATSESRFLTELPENLLLDKNKEKQSRENKYEVAQKNLKLIENLLNSE